MTEVRAEGEDRRLLNEVVGRHAYILDYENDSLRLAHATPGAGTWKATLPLEGIPNRDSITLIIAWSPQELRLSAVDPTDAARGRVATGERSGDRLQVSPNGEVIVVGAAASGVNVRVGGEQVNGPPAIELWEMTREAVRVLLTGTSPEGYLHEVVTSNAALSMLITGLETYCRERFREVEGEGVPVDAVSFLKRFGNTEERDMIKQGRRPEAAKPAPGESLARASILAERVNFQNYAEIKRAFSKGYGLRFGVHLDVENQLVQRVQKLLCYRHRIIHVSPLIAILNEGPDVTAEDWEWSKKPLAEQASEELEKFVRALHAATLRLRPSRPKDATS